MTMLQNKEKIKAFISNILPKQTLFANFKLRCGIKHELFNSPYAKGSYDFK